MTPERQALYEKARSRAQKIVEACDLILNNRETEARACKDADLQVSSFRNFCKNLNNHQEADEKVHFTDKDWGDWREDLLLVITGERVPAPDNFDEIFADICKTNLSEKQAKILQMRLEGCNLEEVGKELGVTRERVRQLEVKIYRILRKPSLRRRLELGDDYMNALEEFKSAQTDYDKEYLRVENAKKFGRVQELDTLKAETEKLKAETDELRNIVTSEVSDTELAMLNTPIEGLGLSVRPFNCLIRHFWTVQHIAKPTAYDVSKLTYSELMDVRNLGNKSLKEIVDVMEQMFGFKFDDGSSIH